MSDPAASQHDPALGDKAEDVAREAADSGWVAGAARAGLVARAVVYLLVGYLAGRIALSSAGAGQASTSRPASGEGALEAIAAHPGGRILLGLLAMGFLGYAVLALVEAAFLHQQTQGATQRWARRLFFAGVAVLYLAFSVYAGSLVVRPRLGPASAGGAHHQEIELTARVLGWRFGQVLVGTVGAVLVVAGLGFGYQALTANFQERLDQQQMPSAIWRAATVAGAIGSWARASVLVLTGTFVGWAAISFNPRRAKGAGRVASGGGPPTVWAVSAGRRGLGAGLLRPVPPGRGALPQALGSGHARAETGRQREPISRGGDAGGAADEVAAAWDGAGDRGRRPGSGRSWPGGCWSGGARAGARAQP